MTYAQKIDMRFGEHMLEAGSFDVFPPHAVLHALESKDSVDAADFRQQVGAHLDLTELNPADQNLLRTRVIGGSVARTALGSYGLHQKGLGGLPFMGLSANSQTEIKNELMDSFGERAARYLDDTGLPMDALLGNRGMTDLPHIPHALVRSQLHQIKARELTTFDRLKNVGSYMNVWPGTFPPATHQNRTIGTNDSVLVQAFGRNTITDKELPTIRDSAERHADARVVFEQLDRQAFDPGDSNRVLADAVDVKLQLDTVIEPLIQWEVAFALWQKDPVKYDQFNNYIHVLWPHSDFYPTYEVKRDSVEIMDRLGMHNPLELAHQDMMVRALGILARLGVEADAYAVDVPFDPHSVQAQTRGAGPWVVRETLTRAEHLVRGRVAF